jgi:hypothetical protein
MAYGAVVTYAILASPGLPPAIQGCPSRAFPVHPGSRLENHAQITVGSDQGGLTTGCWATYDEPASVSAQVVFSFYTDADNVPGWKLDEAYAETGYAAFSSTTVPGLRVDVGVGKMPRYFLSGPSTVSYAISICLCDPRSMAQ